MHTTTPEQVWATLPENLVERFRGIVGDLATGAGARDLDRELPFKQVKALRDAGLGRARLPIENGGLGLDWRTFGSLLIAIAAADSNVPQIFRGHIALVEQALTTPDLVFAQRWIEQIGAGALAGNSWSETSGSTTARASTELNEDPDGTLRVTGRKFYTTGSLFAEWTDTVAHRTADGVDVAALVRLDQPGVSVSDDWDGFGQRLTGTGTILFDQAAVDPVDVLPVADRFAYQTAAYQFVLLTVLTGIAHAAVADAAVAVRARTRVYSHGTATRIRDDVQIQALIGELSAAAFSVQSSTLAVADALEIAYRDAVALRADSANLTLSERARQSAGLAEIRSAQAQVTATTAVQQLTSRLFDTLGASGTTRTAHLDRHWRNARTVSSHNPVLYKQRWIGEWILDGTPPQALWAVGTPAASSPSPTTTSAR